MKKLLLFVLLSVAVSAQASTVPPYKDRLSILEQIGQQCKAKTLDRVKANYRIAEVDLTSNLSEIQKQKLAKKEKEVTELCNPL